MDLKAKLLYSQNWNIGFCEQSIEDLIGGKSLNKIHWMKHPYRDRWFADPFVFKVTENEIVVFVEECFIKSEKGRIAELIIDKKTFSLKEEYILLECETHLSYPAIIQLGGHVYVYPENGQGGCLNLYEYDEKKHKLINPRILLKEPVADATIWKDGDCYYLVATKYPQTQDEAFLYKSSSLFGPFFQVYYKPIIKGKSSSRPAGNFITINGEVYRPFQDCSSRYGGALGISMVEYLTPTYSECEILKLRPQSFKYNLGIHTINEINNIIVIDGYGFLYPRIARCLKKLIQLKNIILR